MIKIIQANSSHRKIIIDLLDEFIFVCCKLIDKPEKKKTRNDYSNKVLDEKILSSDSAIFLAQKNNEYIGIVTIHKIPLIRRGIYDAEIEEMFVKEEYQGTGAAQELIDTAEAWAKNKDINCIQLKSHKMLSRAHSFYKKHGFSDYGKAFLKKL